MHNEELVNVVQRQLEAYNAKNIDSFMKEWGQDAEIYQHPETLLAKGHDEIRKRHLERFKEPDLFGKLISRTVYGNRVVDQEIVTRNFPEGKGTVEVLCIYEIADLKITKAWFLMGKPTISK